VVVVVGQRSYEFSHGMRFPGFCRDWMAVFFLLINGRAARKPSATIRARGWSAIAGTHINVSEN